MEIDDLEYLRDEALIELERYNAMMVEYQEMEYYNRLPAKIEVKVEINQQEPTIKN